MWITKQLTVSKDIPNMGVGVGGSPLSKSWHHFHIWVNYHFNFSLFGNLSTFWFLNILNNPLIILILSLFDINNVRPDTLHHIIHGSIFASSTVIFSFSSPLHLPSVCAMLPQSQLVLAFPIETHPTQLANSFTLLPALRFPFLGLSLLVSWYISVKSVRK